MVAPKSRLATGLDDDSPVTVTDGVAMDVDNEIHGRVKHVEPQVGAERTTAEDAR